MMQFAACLVASIKFSTLTTWGAIIPLVAFVLDRWMVWEGEKYENIEDMPILTKITMVLPAMSIWIMLLIALIKTS